MRDERLHPIRILPANADSDADHGGNHARCRAPLYGAVRKCLPGADSELVDHVQKGLPPSITGADAEAALRISLARERRPRGGTGVGGARTLRMKTLLAIALSVTMLISCGRRSETKSLNITLVTKALDSEWWQRVKAGAEDAAKAHPGVRMAVVAPEREVNIDQQVAILEDQITKRVGALAVAP